MKPIIDWQSVTGGYMHGITASVGDRRAEVLMAYPGGWIAFCWIAGRTCKRMEGEPQHESRQAAIARAAKFLRGETTPDTWPG